MRATKVWTQAWKQAKVLHDACCAIRTDVRGLQRVSECRARSSGCIGCAGRKKAGGGCWGEMKRMQTRGWLINRGATHDGQHGAILSRSVVRAGIRLSRSRASP